MATLRLHVLKPHISLKKYVRRILVTEGYVNNEEILKIGPTGFSYLTYSRYPLKLHYSNRVSENKDQLYLAGQLCKEHPYIKIKGPIFQIGLELFPTTLKYFFEVKSLVDDHLSLSEIYPDIAHNFINVHNEEKEPSKVACGLEKILLNRLSAINPIPFLDESIDIIYKKNGAIELSELVKISGKSERHYRRIFKDTIGISPKKYCKIHQFNAAIQAIQTADKNALYQLALQNGYYDQAHFIHDFNRYLGTSPQNFLQSEDTFLKNYLGAK